MRDGKQMIDQIVANAIDDLAEKMPGVVLTIVNNYYFVSYLEEDTSNQVPIKVNGVYHPIVAKKYSVVDFTMPMTYNYTEFISHSHYLYYLFMDPKIKWYKC